MTPNPGRTSSQLEPVTTHKYASTHPVGEDWMATPAPRKKKSGVTIEDVRRMLQAFSDSYGTQSVLQSELRVLTTLRYRLDVATPLVYAGVLLDVIGHNDPSFNPRDLYPTTLRLLQGFYVVRHKVYERAFKHLAHDRSASEQEKTRRFSITWGTKGNDDRDHDPTFMKRHTSGPSSSSRFSVARIRAFKADQLLLASSVVVSAMKVKRPKRYDGVRVEAVKTEDEEEAVRVSLSGSDKYTAARGLRLLDGDGGQGDSREADGLADLLEYVACNICNVGRGGRCSDIQAKIAAHSAKITAYIEKR
ncbi:hypothetical protein HPB48_020130 [Haemaphysalis longicornis]|uniref:Uncharacterized protein n=1 Tax=Haemaphysalis longicornis TaxID=44386 RepID=A0A9J6GP54_HAELO|nr:hypothetical protein HPB48_020130 [Haemaphysalis longicornis]